MTANIRRIELLCTEGWDDLLKNGCDSHFKKVVEECRRAELKTSRTEDG